MKQLVVISGKGGTGKTSVTAAFVHCAGTSVHCDCDVDAADLHLVLNPEQGTEEVYNGLPAAYIDQDRCTDCGICRDACRFDVINGTVVDRIRCEGCGVCVFVCPLDAVRMTERAVGTVGTARTPYGVLVSGRLYPGAGNSGRMVSQLRSMAETAARERGENLLIIDGSPGIGCAVIASMANTDMAVIVTEPTLSGLHDLERIQAVTEQFSVPARVVINKADIHPDNARAIEAFCRERGVACAGCIPYDPEVTAAMVAGKPLTAYSDGPAALAVKAVWRHVVSELDK